jgi:hypothetical protein
MGYHSSVSKVLEHRGSLPEDEEWGRECPRGHHVHPASYSVGTRGPSPRIKSTDMKATVPLQVLSTNIKSPTDLPVGYEIPQMP